MRQNLFTTWCTHLQQANILFRTDIARIEYLSNADERLRWQANALPSDDLCVENAIMLQRFNRYPLIIDPSGQATEFIMNEHKHKKITKTSFLDDSFRKNLESALRFGNPLLVQVWIRLFVVNMCHLKKLHLQVMWIILKMYA
eukprot:GHVT01014022.1.p1 GENE.GHVT01014022.1~~GHVT01014022.1.p1  ORF type:complete len:143 (+),score=0.48 GHVT01014022.1:257-685(+)